MFFVVLALVLVNNNPVIYCKYEAIVSIFKNGSLVSFSQFNVATVCSCFGINLVNILRLKLQCCWWSIHCFSSLVHCSLNKRFSRSLKKLPLLSALEQNVFCVVWKQHKKCHVSDLAKMNSIPFLSSANVKVIFLSSYATSSFLQ